ncbi:MAG: AraC family ligand binding domain-containing protein, partial [Oscillospiraceae bacterium]|nr:AraC family ligand binding domain-containing protein [Oscillospiraceae bacterium]
VYALGAGDLFLVYPDKPIKYWSDNDNPWTYVWVGFGGSDAGFFLAPAALLCFVAAVKSGRRIAHAKSLRKMSTIIYCCQGNALLFPNALVRVLHLPGIHPLLAFALRAAAVAAIVLLTLYIQKKKPDCFFSRYAA